MKIITLKKSECTWDTILTSRLGTMWSTQVPFKGGQKHAYIAFHETTVTLFRTCGSVSNTTCVENMSGQMANAHMVPLYPQKMERLSLKWIQSHIKQCVTLLLIALGWKHWPFMWNSGMWSQKWSDTCETQRNSLKVNVIPKCIFYPL